MPFTGRSANAGPPLLVALLLAVGCGEDGPPPARGPDVSVWRGGRVARLAAGDHAGRPLVRGRLDGPLERAAARRHGRAFRPAIWSASGDAVPTAVAVLRGRGYGAALDGRVYALSPTRLYRVDPLGVAPPRPPAAADTVAPRPIPWRDGLP